MPHRVGLLARLFEREGKASNLEAAFQAIEQGRARVFLESLGQAHAAGLAALPKDLHRQERELSLKLREIDARIERVQGQPGDQSARTVRQLYAERLEVEDKQTAFLDGLQRTHPQYTGFRYPQPCWLQQARDCLAANEVALLFTVGEEVSWALLLEKQPRPGHKGQGLTLVQLAGAGNSIPSSIRCWPRRRCNVLAWRGPSPTRSGRCSVRSRRASRARSC